MPNETTARAVDEAINTYNDTVAALVCFGHVLTWDDDAKAKRAGSDFALGRKMDTSTENAVAPSTTVTPDLIAVVTPEYGIVGEAKPSFHGTVEDRADDLRQLMKYDDNLVGWQTPNERIAKADVVLLVHYSRKGDTQDVLEAATKDDRYRLARNFAAITFTRMPQVQEFMSLEHFWGRLSDPAIQKRLRPLPVPLEKVWPLYPAKMYDDPPPPPLLIQLAWDHVFNQLVSEEEYQSGKRGFEIRCSVEKVRDMLAETCGPPRTGSRQPQIPQMDWVKQMFELLVKMKLAAREKSKPSEYRVFYRRKKIDFFVDRYVKVTTKKKRPVGRPLGGRRLVRDHPELPLQQ
jgi:hypothetical protein